MNIVILGAGLIGSYLASVLSKEEHNVILVDQDEKRLEKAAADLDIATIAGEASDWKLFDELLENEPHFFLAMTSSDETNLIACSIAKNLGYPQTICRISEISYLNRMRLDFGRIFFVDHFIGAEVIAAYEILKSLISPSNLFVENFAHGSVQLRTVRISENWNKQSVPLKDLNLPPEMIVALIRRPYNGKEVKDDEIIFPHGEDVILPNDEVTIIGETNTLFRLNELFSLKQHKVHSVVIIGGSTVAIHLTHILQKYDAHVKIIERDEKRANELSKILTQATIINHDGRDLKFLQSEKANETNALISCMTKDEKNFLIASIAKEAGCEKVISLISDPSLGPILEKLDISFAVSEKVHIVNRILSIIHAQNILSISSLADDQAKVVEMKVSQDSQLVGIPISDLSTYLPKDLIIATIENKGRIMIGKGDRIISPNDTIILITSPRFVHELQHLF